MSTTTKHIISILTMLIVACIKSNAATDVYVGYEVEAVVENGDTIPFEKLRVLYVYPNPYDILKSERKRKLFWKLVRDVKKAHPYSLQIAEEVKRIDEQTKGLDESKRKDIVKKQEDALVEKFKPELKKLTLRQGKILIKLVDRECGKTSYELVKEYRGTVRAVFWQGFACMLGANLKTGFSAEEDEAIEYIIKQIEQGRL